MEASEEGRDSIFIGDDQNLEDVAEDPESGDSETANEVEVSEKALKFKIATEGSQNPNSSSGGRKSYPGSRKGSRERVHNFNATDFSRAKLKSGALSFDQRCLHSSGTKKLSFDKPEFLDEYAIILNKRNETVSDSSPRSGEFDCANCKSNREDECVLSKETLNLNKRNSEHSVKVSVQP